MRSATLPLPAASSTRSAITREPELTPVMPVALSAVAAIVPETWVP